MGHKIEVHLAANIEKYQQGMDAAKKTGSESMGFIAGIVDKVKSLFGGMWDSFKSLFSGVGDKSRGFFSSMSSDLDKTKNKMGETEGQTNSLIEKIGIGLVAAVAAATAALGIFLKRGLDAQSMLANMAIANDIGAAQISRFEGAYLRSNLTVKEFSGSMAKLQDEMKKAAAGDGNNIFSTLGVKIVDANNALLKTDEVTIAVAKKIAGMSSEAEKYAAAAKLGFEGKVQVLEDIAHASTLAASTTDDQAGAVVRLGKIWHEILPGGKSMWAEISSFLTTSLTPAMTDASTTILNSKNTIVDAFNQIFGTSSMFPSFGEKIKEWGKDVSQWFSKVADSATTAAVSIMKFVAQKTGLGDPNAYVKAATALGYVPGAVTLASGKSEPVITDAEKEARKQLDATTKSIGERIEVMKRQIQLGETLTEGQRALMQLESTSLKLKPEERAADLAKINSLIALEKQFKAGQESRAAGAAAAKKEEEAYAHLIAAIATKTQENKLELLAGENATESQKNQIKMEQELASGKITTASASYAVARALLVEQAASERLLLSQKAEKDVFNWIVQSTEARNAAKDSLALETAMYGKSADAHEIAAIKLKNEATLERFIIDQRKAGKPVTDDMITQLRNEITYRTGVEQAAMAQSKAYAYAQQLKDENKRFGLDYILDEKERAAAILKIDDETWQERIALAGEGTDAQKKLMGEYVTWYGNQVAKPELDAQKKLWESIESTAHDTFISIFDSGKSAFDRLRDTLKNGLLEMLYQMTLKKWIFQIGATVSGGGIAGMAQAADGGGGSGLGGMGSIAGIGKSIYSAISGGFEGLSTTVADAVQATMYQTGMSSSLLTNGSFANAAGGAAGYLGGAAIGVYGGRAISGGYSAIGGQTGNTAVNAGTIIGAVFGGPVGAAIGGIIGGGINRLFGMKAKELGITTLNGTFGSGGFSGTSNTAWTQKGGLFRSNKSGVDKSAIDADMAKTLAAGYDALKAASADYAKVLGLNADSIAARSQSLSIALTKDAAANQKAITSFFIGVGDDIARELVPALSEFTKDGETASATLQRIATNYKALDDVLYGLGRTFGAVGLDSIKARERLIDLSGGVQQFGQSADFFAQNFMTEAERLVPVAKNVETALADLGLSGVDTREQFKNVVQGLDLTTEKGATTYAALMKVQQAFAMLHPVAEKVADVVDQAAVALAQSQVAFMDGMNRGGAAGPAAFNEDQMMREFYAAAAQAQAEAAAKLQAAWKGLTDSIFGEVQRIRGVIDGSSGLGLASAQSNFAIATAQARAGDQAAAASLPQLSQALLSIAESQATSLVDLQRIRGMTAGSLIDTGVGAAGQYGLSVPNGILATGPRSSGGSDTGRLETLIESLTNTVASQQAALNRIASHTDRAANTLEVVTNGGDAMITKAVP